MASKRTLEIIEIFRKMYSDEVRCYLDHSDAWQLLVATILSAQCTDARVNIITKDLFVKYKTIEDYANADLAEMEQDIHHAGFYHNKAHLVCLDKNAPTNNYTTYQSYNHRYPNM